MTIRKVYLLIALSVGLFLEASAQGKKIWASGAARSIFQQNNYSSEGDTVTPGKLNSGHALVDLAINAKPNDQTFLHAMVRIRNDFGGFWGSGVTFDMRQLYLKGLIKDAVRYQLGDINYKLTPYTFYNHTEELTNAQSEALNIYREITHYDLFYFENNTWRQQGAAVDFGLLFPAVAEELQVNMFTFRNRPAEVGRQSDRIFFGGNATLIQSKHLQLGANYVDLMDINGTSNTTDIFHNPVISGSTQVNAKVSSLDLTFRSESGISEMYVLNDPNSQTLRDYFMDFDLEISANKHSAINLSYINVGPQFRSVGAQNRRVNFDGQNMMYTRIGNDQNVRPITQMDLLQDASLYRMNLSPDLVTFAPQYDNIQPFGDATPNRKGFGLDMNYAFNALGEARAEVKNLQEVVGQGTEVLRTYRQLNGQFTVNVDTMLSFWKNTLQLTGAFTLQQTTREAALQEANVDLRSTIADIGIKIGLMKDMDIVGNYRIIQSQGNELLSVRNDRFEVEDFQTFETDMDQKFLILALRYHFDDKNKLNVVWQRLTFSDKVLQTPDFAINQFAIVYSMFF
jgi:hypothetical protein